MALASALFDPPAQPSRASVDVLVPAVLAVAMFLQTFVFFLGLNPYVRPVALLCFVPPVLVLLKEVRSDFRYLQWTLILLLLMTGPLWLSTFVHVTEYDTQTLGTAVVRILALTVYVATIATLMAHPRGETILARSLQMTTVLFLALFVYAAVVHPVWHWGRFQPADMHPNWWGEVLVAVVFGASFLPGRLWRYACWLVALAGLTLVQSRSSLGGSLLIIAFATLQHEGLRRLLLLSVITLFLILPLAVLLDLLLFEFAIFGSTIRWIGETVLLLNHPGRGLGTGLVGRDETWHVGLGLLAEQPFLGVGFSRADLFSESAVGTVIHNGHLGLLADLGAILYPILAALLLTAVVLAVKKQAFVELGMIVSFAFFMMMITPRAINVSVLSMLLWMMVAKVWFQAPRGGDAAATAAAVSQDGVGVAPRRGRIGARWAKTSTAAGSR